MAFKPVQSQVDFPTLEKELLDYWDQNKVLDKYLSRNSESEKKFSFLDGPKTANNPLGVHHAWGRTYKDLWQRFYNMRGFKQRFQNGYDEQGLWVEVEVEKSLGLKTKRDIENIVPGDKLASLEKFIELCKERVNKYGEIITQQSKRLGQFMDWQNSYHTGSDWNNYMIWHYIKNVHNRGWLYRGHDSVPWCPRCGTAISQHEMQPDDYKDLTHDSIYFKLPVKNKPGHYLLVWTTTPWTIPANVAVAINKNETYRAHPISDNEWVWVMDKAAQKLISNNILQPFQGAIDTAPGTLFLDWEYEAPFDHLDRVNESLGSYKHKVVIGDELIMPISSEEGTGLVHVAPGAGAEDFQLGKKERLPVIDVIDESATYLSGLNELSGKNAKSNPEVVSNYLKEYEKGKFLFKVVPYTHRYPTCWRCHSELVWRVVDEWYIAVDKEDPKDKESYRKKMIKVAKQMSWQPKFIASRELDWLANLHDWMISKKRYWGLALPIWECNECHNFEVVGGYEELKELAVEGWEKFEGHSPHRPWVDQVKIRCPKCDKLMNRVPDVGNVWLDAGIVPYSTLTSVSNEKPSYITDKKYWSEWFPPEFSVEMYEQTRLWFYAMIAMSSALEEEVPVKQIFGHGRVVDEKGEEMHNSRGNAISLDEAFDQAGSDSMRWLFVTANPATDVRFGYNLTNDIKRRFLLILWNTYKFFVEYANLASWDCKDTPKDIKEKLTTLDRWVLARLTEVVLLVNSSLQKYDAATAAKALEEFIINDLSTWYIRRSRDRVGPTADQEDQNLFLSVTYGVLVTLSKILAPFMPFISESIYRNLTDEESVHLEDYPQGDESLLDRQLIKNMEVVRKLSELGHSQRKEANLKLRQPLAVFSYQSKERLPEELERILAEELNVKSVEHKKSTLDKLTGELNTKLTPQLKEEGLAREVIRQIQSLRKEQGLTLADKVIVKAPNLPESQKLLELVKKQTNATSLESGETLTVTVV